MSVAGVRGISLIPALLFILPMTLIPSVSDPETSINPPGGIAAQSASCRRLPCCTASRPANLWPCLGCCWCHPAPSTPVTFLTPLPFPTVCSLSLSLSRFALSAILADDEMPNWHRVDLLFLSARALQTCHRTVPPPPNSDWTCSRGGGGRSTQHKE